MGFSTLYPTVGCCRSRGGWRQPEISSTASLTCVWATRFTTDVLKSLWDICLVISELVAAWSQRHGALPVIRPTFDRFLDKKMSGWRVLESYISLEIVTKIDLPLGINWKRSNGSFRKKSTKNKKCVGENIFCECEAGAFFPHSKWS